MNPLILAIETSSLWTGVAVSQGAEILASRQLLTQAGHTEALSALIAECLTHSGKESKDIDLLAVSIGPGSFTALRIGLLTAQGIALARGIKIVPVMTLDVLNESLPFSEEMEFRLPVIDAYKNEVFTAFYQGNKKMSEAVIVDPCFVSALVGGSVHKEPVTVFGPAVEKYEASLRASLKKRIRFPDNLKLSPNPEALVRLAWKRRDECVSPDALQPYYIRMPDAKRPKSQ